MVVRRKNRTSTGLDLTPAKTLVAYKNGNWHDPAIWKDEDTDLPIAMTPRKIDNVKIIGFTVTAQDNIECNNLTVGASNQTVSSVLDVTDKTVDTYGDITFAGKSDVLTRVSPGWGTWNVRGDWTLNNGAGTTSYVIWGESGQTYHEPTEVTRPEIRYLSNSTLEYLQDNTSDDARMLWFAQGTYIADGVTVTLKKLGTNEHIYHAQPGGYFIMGAGSTFQATTTEGLHSVSDGTNEWTFGTGTTIDMPIVFGIDGSGGEEILQEIDFTGLTWQITKLDAPASGILTGIMHQLPGGSPASHGGIKLLSDVSLTSNVAQAFICNLTVSNNSAAFGDTWAVLDLNGHTFTFESKTTSSMRLQVGNNEGGAKTHQHGLIRFNGGKIVVINKANNVGLLVGNSRDDATNGNLAFDFTDGGSIELYNSGLQVSKTAAGVFDETDTGERIIFQTNGNAQACGTTTNNPLPKTRIMTPAAGSGAVYANTENGLLFFNDVTLEQNARFGGAAGKVVTIAAGKKINGTATAYIIRAGAGAAFLLYGDAGMLNPAGGFNISNCTYGSGGNLTATGSTDGGGNTNITFE